MRVLRVLIVILGIAARANPQDVKILVRGGTFRMGTAVSDLPDLKRRYGVSFPGAFESEAPDHTVTLSDFRIDRHEVTNARIFEFVQARPEWGKGALGSDRHNGRYLDHWTDGRPPAPQRDHPAVFVTWHAAQAFCRWAGGRLPTEAEWEYAARARDDREFPWGAALPSPDHANYSASRRGTTAPVGSYPPNPLGLHDMAGNVWEFVLDAWEPAYTGAPQTNPVAGGPVGDEALRAVGGRRAIRGGSYGGAVVNLRTRWRDSHVATNAVEFVGFRCAYPVRAAR